MATRILVINGNSSSHITSIIRREAKLGALEVARVRCISCANAPKLIQSRSDNMKSAAAMLALVKAGRKNYDAIVVAVSLDTAVQALRTIVQVPVIGMTQAAFLCAGVIGPRVGAVVFGKHLARTYRELFAKHVSPAARLVVLESRLVPTEVMSPERIDSHILADLFGLVSRKHVDSIVIVGAALAGTARRLQPYCPVPLLDGISCGVLLAAAVRNASPPDSGPRRSS